MSLTMTISSYSTSNMAPRRITRRVLVVALGEEGQRLLYALRGRAQAVALGVLAKAAQDFAIHLLGAESAQPFASPRLPCEQVYSPQLVAPLSFILSPNTQRNCFLSLLREHAPARPRATASCNKSKIAVQKFSVVGTRLANNGSRFRLAWSKRSSTLVRTFYQAPPDQPPFPSPHQPAAHQNLNKIIVAVTVLVVALSVRRAVLLPP